MPVLLPTICQKVLFMPPASDSTGQNDPWQGLRELGEVYTIAIPASLAGGAAYGVAGALAMIVAAGPLQVGLWGVVLFLVFLQLVSWTVFACMLLPPLLDCLIPRGVMTAARMPWLPGQRTCGLLGAVLGLAAIGAAALLMSVIEALGWGEGLAKVQFVALSIGMLVTGVSLGLRFHAHRAGSASSD